MAVDARTNPANLAEYRGFLGNLKYQRKVYLNSFYRWGDILRELDKAGVKKWGRSEERQFAREADDVVNKRLKKLCQKRDFVLYSTIAVTLLGAVIGYRRSQRNFIPGVPIGMVFGYPFGYATSYMAATTALGTWKFDDMEVWEKYADWYIRKKQTEKMVQTEEDEWKS
eukprot:Plantae.Rhodophyta-Purpureofilum_apyrenoidigerum.ctg189.p2 GENE.Plantae.Rhodophyta-Purpureofilum_apyrenoidigerum.ctg189~~Plantae.Rhodophyta-Purpureofilum_apyrenoidigerum.ctg189.p2  ORF type:complete len:169 (+),score=41.72 Plantae.Rhodophyta-Purpureofilum_apyrenoidigerum.ctg189:103-609(+)